MLRGEFGDRSMPPENRLAARIEQVRIQGFRSLADVTLNLGNLGVVIGANGSGKSNLIRFFDMLSWMLASSGRLGEFVERHGGADDQLFGGNKRTPRLQAEIQLRTKTGRNDYRFSLAYASPDRFFFSEEDFRYSRGDLNSEAEWILLKGGHREAEILNLAQAPAGTAKPQNCKTAKMIINFLRGCATYQFHDTSPQSPMQQYWDSEDINYLRGHGGNLAPVLLRLQNGFPRHYDMISRQIQRLLPTFGGFELQKTNGKVLLRWRNKYTPDKTIGAHLTSDGSLRLFALITLLNLPGEMLPDVILLDEPELGLHPAGITLISRMILNLSHDRQILVATQSPLLVDAFSLDAIIVAECPNGKTQFTHKAPQEYQQWLDDGFTAGELWLKNVLGGRP